MRVLSSERSPALSFQEHEEISVTVLEGVQFGDSLVLVQVDVGRSCG